MTPIPVMIIYNLYGQTVGRATEVCTNHEFI